MQPAPCVLLEAFPMSLEPTVPPCAPSVLWAAIPLCLEPPPMKHASPAQQGRTPPPVGSAHVSSVERGLFPAPQVPHPMQLAWHAPMALLPARWGLPPMTLARAVQLDSTLSPLDRVGARRAQRGHFQML